MSSKDYLTNDKVPLSREVLLSGEEDSGSRSHLPIEDRVMKEVSQFFGQELTPLMAGESEIKERIRRTLRILRKEQERLGEEDYRRMSSILYALATKFLKEDDLNEMKEEFGMTILGQMLYDDGRKAGLEEGKAEGAEVNLIRNICSLMETMKLSAEQAMEALQVPKAEWGKYSKLL